MPRGRASPRRQLPRDGTDLRRPVASSFENRSTAPNQNTCTAVSGESARSPGRAPDPASRAAREHGGDRRRAGDHPTATRASRSPPAPRRARASRTGKLIRTNCHTSTNRATPPGVETVRQRRTRVTTSRRRPPSRSSAAHSSCAASTSRTRSTRLPGWLEERGLSLRARARRSAAQRPARAGDRQRHRSAGAGRGPRSANRPAARLAPLIDPGGWGPRIRQRGRRARRPGPPPRSVRRNDGNWARLKACRTPRPTVVLR